MKYELVGEGLFKVKTEVVGRIQVELRGEKCTELERRSCTGVLEY